MIQYEIKKIITNQSQIIDAYLIGSYAKGNFCEKSDIDLLIKFDFNITSNSYILELKRDLKKVTKRDIDIIVSQFVRSNFKLESMLKNSIKIK